MNVVGIGMTFTDRQGNRTGAGIKGQFTCLSS